MVRGWFPASVTSPPTRIGSTSGASRIKKTRTIRATDAVAVECRKSAELLLVLSYKFTASFDECYLTLSWWKYNSAIRIGERVVFIAQILATSPRKEAELGLVNCFNIERHDSVDNIPVHNWIKPHKWPTPWQQQKKHEICYRWQYAFELKLTTMP